MKQIPDDWKEGEIQPGCHILIKTEKGIDAGTVTFCSKEKGQVVCDYDDSFGNPRWCYAAQIVSLLT